MQHFAKKSAMSKFSHWKHTLKSLCKLVIVILWFTTATASASPPYSNDIQQITVKGVVSDANSGETLPGVSILAEGTGKGTISDLNGNYTIDIDNEAIVLVFSFIGYQTQRITVGTQTTINVKLAQESKNLDEVVVVGYGTQKKSDLTGSIATVSSDAIKKSTTSRVEQAMQGKTAGIQVTQNSGAPGASMMVRIRGVGTVNNSDPLYVVDGVPVGGIDYLNTNDIQSIDILKDASACAIYGSRGANGVILITTKKGSSAKSTINFDMYQGVQTLWKKIDMCNASEYAMLYNRARTNAGMSPIAEFVDYQSLGEGTDWLSEIFRPAVTKNYQLSAMGGSEISTYSISGGYFTQEGTIKNSNYERFSFRINTENKLASRFRIGNNLALTHSKSRTVPFGNMYGGITMNALLMDPTVKPHNADGTYGFSNILQQENPYILLDYRTNNESKSSRLVGNIYGELELLKDLKFKTNFGLDLAYNEDEGFNPTYYVSPTYKNDFNSIYHNSSVYSTWLLENTLTYSKTINTDHNITLLGGITAQEQNWQTLSGSRSNVPNNEAYMQHISSGTKDEHAGGTSDAWALLSYLARANYVYSNKYMLTASFRRDGSSRFGPNNRFGTFPSASFGWIVSNENFWRPIPGISSLKFRAGWGQIGNQEIGLHDYASLVYSGQDYALGLYPNETIGFGSSPTIIPNTDIKWETTVQSNFGIDLSLFNNQLTLTGDYFVKNTTDMLLTVPIPMSVGASPSMANAGEIQNKGFEFVAEYRKTTGQLTYTASANFSVIKNEVISLGNGGSALISGDVKGRNVTRTDVGHSIGEFYGWVVEGIFQTPDQLTTHAFQNSATSLGDLMFKDIDGNGVIDDKDKIYIGSPIPKLMYGFNFNVAYKGFDLTLFIQGVYGNKMYNGYRFWTMGWGEANYESDMLKSWTPENTNTDVPRIFLGDPNDNLRVSTRFVESGSYLRIKNIQFGYTISPKVLKMIGMQSARVYVSSQNLLTFTKYNGFDPEIGGGGLSVGIDRGEYPQPRVFMGGVSISF